MRCLPGLFPAGHMIERGPHGIVNGKARLESIGEVVLVEIVDGTPLGIEGALALAGHVLAVVARGESLPIVVLVDTSSQNMSRRDELLGLNEYLGHLSKCLAFAGTQGHRTAAVLYGRAAAGALIATSLSTQALAALPGAEPFVMDLPSISRVTKLPLGQLEEMAKSTPIFAPGLDPLFATGAVTEKWDATQSLSKQLITLLQRPIGDSDRRDEIGRERGGRKQAAAIAERVKDEAANHA